jgi:hypothetical protein
MGVRRFDGCVEGVEMDPVTRLQAGIDRARPIIATVAFLCRQPD